MSQFIGVSAAIMAAFCWAITAIFFTKVSRAIGSTALNGLRLILAIIFLFVSIIIHQGNFYIDLPASSYYFIILSGIVGLAIGDALFFHSFKLLGPQLPTIIMSIWPALAYLFGSFLLSEKITLLKTIAIAITLGFVTWVATEKKSNNTPDDERSFSWQGVIFAVLAANAQAISYCFAKKAMIVGEDISTLVLSFLRMVSAAIVIWGISTVTGNSKKWYISLKEQPGVRKYLVYGSFLGAFLGVWFSLIAANYTTVGTAATLMSTVPIWVMIIAIFAYNIKPTHRTIIGTIGAIFGIAILMFS